MLWGFSRNTRGWVDHSAGESIGFVPLDDDAEDCAPRAAVMGPTLGVAQPGELLGGNIIGSDRPLGEPW